MTDAETHAALIAALEEANRQLAEMRHNVASRLAAEQTFNVRIAAANARAEEAEKQLAWERGCKEDAMAEANQRGVALKVAADTWRELAQHLPAEWDGGDLGYLVSDMDAALAATRQRKEQP